MLSRQYLEGADEFMHWMFTHDCNVHYRWSIERFKWCICFDYRGRKHVMEVDNFSQAIERMRELDDVWCETESNQIPLFAEIA